MKFNLETFKKAWDNKTDIIAGIKNSIIVNNEIEALARERDSICRSNVCGYYDPLGVSEKAVMKGARSCAACGCKLDWKQRAPDADCGLIDIDQPPLWVAVIDKPD